LPFRRSLDAMKGTTAVTKPDANTPTIAMPKVG
jgi:hypothetical protein